MAQPWVLGRVGNAVIDSMWKHLGLVSSQICKKLLFQACEQPETRKNDVIDHNFHSALYVTVFTVYTEVGAVKLGFRSTGRTLRAPVRERERRMTEVQRSRYAS